MDSIEYYVEGCLYVGFTEVIEIPLEAYESLIEDYEYGLSGAVHIGTLKHKGTPILVERCYNGFALITREEQDLYV